ncbi:replication initiator protein [Microviridae sp.]|nr:replication initiator protein [Microviridae sp.]
MKCSGPINTSQRSKLGEPITRPCGQCLHCRINIRDYWVARCLLESRVSTIGQFWTLTLSDEGLDTFKERGPVTLKENFVQSLRQVERRAGNGNTIRCFGCLEHGEMLGRPHYHFLVWNHLYSAIESTPYRPGLPRPKFNIPSWPHGHVDCCPLTTKSARYVCKYVTDFERDQIPDAHKVFHVKRPALGSRGLALYVDELSRSPAGKWEQSNFIQLDGKQWALDRTMHQKYLALCRQKGIRIESDRHHKVVAKRIARQLEVENANWQKQDFLNTKRAVKEALYSQQVEANELKKFAIFQRALAFSAQNAA